MHHFAQGKSFDDFEPYLGNSKHASRTPVTLENNVSKSLAADNVKASNAAKIKVEVRKRPLNKEELMKNEEDIIETHFNSLIVQEIKLKLYHLLRHLKMIWAVHGLNVLIMKVMMKTPMSKRSLQGRTQKLRHIIFRTQRIRREPMARPNGKGNLRWI
ncbi:uncharacterized protein LOC111405141 isoform X2 [Olea europaea var. sylvestris]|uniref:uncharacterized protein LOC111405141 isoform X2 n=1 Tax=Olea europaea var. sylvestris TaxID=158386 RepID=UPI000C1D7E88|nr:uncharacterized protein LOC111405141 isoform X2 [Olea europaea var. sylvestris]XP_022889668.1 uncharacterized protein LOC111405141 isoform X2 [Olea europaea var. sylvestris]